ncbi:hypothetical protein E1263_05930 [Kribbella antibiotica]|uniref:Uncharacterized protein n=1 Tax=Kribbella antibiotica TaxID=190195 RepID=A0A4R4ZUR4_9ACTN|nr:hypothetical protein [Kribbella antibiotica]TDD61924.1 hypothetical protein E1263_05930 [Kribbella antibiotica]
MNENEPTVTTQHGTTGLPDHWMAFLGDALRTSDDFVIVGDGRDHHYIQARNTDGVYNLEYRDGSPQLHFCTEVSNQLVIADAIQQWLAGERGFVTEHAWERLTEWD